MGVVEPVNPEICVCLHMKQEHGGKLTGFFKSIPGGQDLARKLAQERLTNPEMPRPKKVHGCLICDCKEFRPRSSMFDE
jgi:hypothetical protein